MFQRINDFALYLFIFTIVFEAWDPFGLKGVFTIARIAGLFYLASSLPFIYNRLFANETKIILLSLVFFLFFYTFSTLRYFQPGTPDQSAFSMALFQNIVMFLFITNHLLQSNRATKYALVSFFLSVVLMGLLYLLGIGIDVEIELEKMRLTLFGENPNMIGNKAVVAYLIALYFLLTPPKNNVRKSTVIKILFIATIPLFFSLVLASGSRGAFLIFFIAGLFALLLLKLPVAYKTILLVTGIIVTIYIFDFVYLKESVMHERLRQTIEEGEFGGRDIMIKNSINVFKDYPLFGVGRIALQTGGKTRDPHNVFLAVLLASGLFGFLPFLYFNYKVFNKVIFNYRLSKDFFYPVLAITLLLIMFKSGGLITTKFLWFNYAILFGNNFDN